MNKAELLNKLAEFNIRPGKHFGQNFMTDENMLDFIYRKTDPRPGELILEVGPGFGALTEKLLASGANVISVELDKRLYEFLKKNMRSENFTLVCGDACRIDIDAIICEFRRSGQDFPAWRCVANLPYSISTPFMAQLLKMRNPPQEMFFMLQKETAERFIAKPRTKEYGAISVMVQAMFSTEILRTVPPQVFFPPPKVESALARFKLKNMSEHERERIRELSPLAKLAFSHRRKKLSSNLASSYTKDSILEAFDAIHVGPDVRAEELELVKFINMLRHLVRSPLDSTKKNSEDSRQNPE